MATERSWRFALLTPAETGRRNRRTVEGALLGAAAIVVGLTAVVARSAPGHDEDVGRALTTVLGWAEALWRVAFVGLLGLALVIVVGVLVRRRWDLARDLLVAVLVLGAAGAILGRVVESDWVPLEGHLLSRWGYPELRLTAATAVLVVAGPELVHWARVLAAWLVPLATVSAVVLGAALPSAALGALALGLGAGAIVRLLFGSAAGVPPTEHVREAMAALGVEVSDLSPVTRQHVGVRRVRWPRHRGSQTERSRARSRRAGHAATGTTLAPPGVPRPTPQRSRRPARAGRARGPGHAHGRAGRRSRTRGRDRRARPRGRRAGRHPPSRTSTRSNSRAPIRCATRRWRISGGRSPGFTQRASPTAAST